MKYIFLILLIPTLCFAKGINFVSVNGSGPYANKEDCEKTEKSECIRRVIPKDIPSDVLSLKEIEVDDPEKPIIEESEASFVEEELVDGECSEGFKPVQRLTDPPTTVCIKLLCEAPKELQDGKCKQVVGFEKKLEKQFVVDPAKVKAKEDKKRAQEAKVLSCEQIRALLDGSAIDDKSKLADVMEVTRRLLGWYKECR